MIIFLTLFMGGSHWALVAKNLPAIAGDTRDTGSVSGSGRSPGVGNGNSLQYALLENPMGKGAWRATSHGAAKGQIRLSEHKTTFITEMI